MSDEKGEGDARDYSTEEKEYHLTRVWFMKLNYNFVLFHSMMPQRLLLAIGQNHVLKAFAERSVGFDCENGYL